MTDQEREDIVYQIAVINAHIADIESKTYRQLREIALGMDSGGTASAKLTEYTNQIMELREQRTALTTQLEEASE